MSAHSSTTAFHQFSSPNSRGFPPFSPANTPVKINFTGVWHRGGGKDERLNFSPSLRCNVLSKPGTEEYIDLIQKNGLPAIKWHEIVENDIQEESLKVSTSNEIKDHIESIRAMFNSMDDGEISASAYDTAWLALVQDIEGSGTPQFPSCLEWIANNQLPDGSWGDRDIFSAHDRIINTVACVIALRSWHIHPEKSKRGMSFVKENMYKLEDENTEHMPIGFEVAFPSLIELARKLDIEVPDDSPFLQEIYAQRNLKLTKIPKDILHNVPTTLLHSLEGMSGLEWEKLLKLQSPDGSFLFSPASTAFALMETKDDNCLRYLNNAVEKFNGGVPNVYPVDLFEHIWVVDRLQRLGISRYFGPEIKQCIDYVYRYWSEEGICWARNSTVHDIDDTAMGFRLLRLHGYEVSADVFRHFENGGEFFCFAGQSNQAVTGMYNLYRASQVLFPGEDILEDAKKFSFKFLREKQATNELLDKWIITKDLPGEVGYALDVPWHASLPRLETRFFLDQYGGEDDVWIGKTLYRMPYVNNEKYLELAKLDYNNCQAMHQQEWDLIQEWHEECNLEELGMSQRSLLLQFYLATASIFETERSKERLAWAKTAMLVETIMSYFEREEVSREHRRALVQEFRNSSNTGYGRYKKGRGFVGTLLGTINQLSLDVLVTHGKVIHDHLRHAWEMWLLTWQEEGDVFKGEAELLVRTISLCGGRCVSEDYRRLSDVTNRVCHQLRRFQSNKIHDTDSCNTYTGGITTMQIESSMQELVQLVHCDSSDGLDADIKQTFLAVAKTFYYTAYCNPRIVSVHIAKVLFDRLL